jgi:hypothetical protein
LDFIYLVLEEDLLLEVLEEVLPGHLGVWCAPGEEGFETGGQDGDVFLEEDHEILDRVVGTSMGMDLVLLERR